MPEREGRPEQDPYWTSDEEIGEITLRGEPYALHLQLHESEERFRNHEALLPLPRRTGTRAYFHAKPYILEPKITLSVGLYPEVRGSAIGEVTNSEWLGLRRVEIGQAQAWYYPADRTLVLWECFLEERYRHLDPATDPAQLALWTGFERTLLGRLPQAARIITTWEDLYPRERWRVFLQSQGFNQEGPAVFTKELARVRTATRPHHPIA